jgi:hypothetical protein
MKKNKSKKPMKNSEPNVKIQVRKPHQPDWEHCKIIALVVAKRKEHMANIEQVDGCDQFETIVTKWKNVFKIVMKWVALHTSRTIQHVKTSGVPSLVISRRLQFHVCMGNN